MSDNSSFDQCESPLVRPFTVTQLKTLKFKRPLQQIKKPCRAETLQNVKSLEGLTSDGTRTAEGFVGFSFGKS